MKRRIKSLVKSLRNKASSTIKVRYKDEDGEDEALFQSQREADKWIEYQSSLKYIGEKFEVISISKN